MITSHARGVEAEATAAAYLREAGYTILHMRYKTKYGEVDIIATEGSCLCFVEVKAHHSVVQSLEAVTPRTQKRIEQSALFFLSEYPDYNGWDMRFDVIAVGVDNIITHLDNAWVAGA